MFMNQVNKVNSNNQTKNGASKTLLMYVLFNVTVVMDLREKHSNFSLSTTLPNPTLMFTSLMEFLILTLKWSPLSTKLPKTTRILCDVISFVSLWVGLIYRC